MRIHNNFSPSSGICQSQDRKDKNGEVFWPTVSANRLFSAHVERLLLNESAVSSDIEISCTPNFLFARDPRWLHPVRSCTVMNMAIL